MYQIKNGNQNAILLLHEIYGINQHIKDTANDLASNGYDLYYPNLLGVENYFKYENESYPKSVSEYFKEAGFESDAVLAAFN